MEKEKKGFFHRLTDISRIHHRAAFADVEYRITPQESVFMKMARDRYSCRGFENRPVPEKDIQHIIEAARLAPTAANKQPVHVWVIKSPEALAKLKEATKYTFDAPVVFLVGAKPEEAWVRKYDGHNGAEIDAAIVGTHIMFEVAALELGTTWVGSFDPAKIKELFPETAGYEPVAIFPVGFPATDPGPNHEERKTKEEISSVL